MLLVSVIRTRNQQDQAIGQASEMRRIRAAFKILAADAVSAFFSSLPCQGDELAQVAIAIPVHGQANQTQSILKEEFAADQEMQAGFFGFRMGSDDACHGAFVRDRECCIAQACGALDQLFRHGSAFQKTEAGAAMKLGVRKKGGGWDGSRRMHGVEALYPNSPCRYQPLPSVLFLSFSVGSYSR